MRELLFCSPGTAARMAWFESVAKSLPRWKPPLERDVYCRAMGEEASTVCRGLGERTPDQASRLVEYQDVRREGVGRRECAPDGRARLIVAAAGDAVSRFENEDFAPPRIIAERDGGREIQTAFEYRHLEALRHDDVCS
jgi:hypothetical protein